jgi:hypothetical protein
VRERASCALRQAGCAITRCTESATAAAGVRCSTALPSAQTSATLARARSAVAAMATAAVAADRPADLAFTRVARC